MQSETLPELDAMRSALAHLVESLNEILRLPPLIHQSIILDQFNTVLARFESAVKELNAPAFKAALVHPLNLIPEDPEFIPRVLLRTKLIPEIDDDEAAVVAAVMPDPADTAASSAPAPMVSAFGAAFQPFAAPPSANSSGAHPDLALDPATLRSTLQETENKAEQHDMLIQASIETFTDMRLELEPTLTKSTAFITSSSISSSSDTNASSMSASMSSHTRSSLSSHLDRTLAWMSSGSWS